MCTCVVLLCVSAGEEEKDEPPKPTWRPPPVIPKEAAKSGANKKTYFVCNEGTYLH